MPGSPTPALASPLPSPALSPQSLNFATLSRSPQTWRAYSSDWRQFAAFAAARGQSALPADPATVADYCSHLATTAGRKPATIARALAAISQAHHLAGWPSPATSAPVRAVMAGIRRSLGSAQQAKTALSPHDLARMLTDPGPGLWGLRNRALILTAFAAALRRSELVALQLHDLESTPEGFILTIRRSKTDQGGEGNLIGIPRARNAELCPVAALTRWIETAPITAGPLFRAIHLRSGLTTRALEDHRVASIVKELAARAGLDPAAFSAHSLRSGLATSAARAGASERSIMEQTRHKSLTQVRRYIQRGSLFADNAAARAL